MKTLTTTNGYVILISDEDYKFISQWTWTVGFREEVPNQVYRDERGKRLNLAKEVLKSRGISVPDQVDHKDRNIRNNQFENLRPATASQNQMNQGLGSNNSTGFKGVSIERSTGKFRAVLQVKGKVIKLGRFINPEAAAKAYDVAAKRYHQDFAVLNFPEQ